MPASPQKVWASPPRATPKRAISASPRVRHHGHGARSQGFGDDLTGTAKGSLFDALDQTHGGHASGNAIGNPGERRAQVERGNGDNEQLGARASFGNIRG